MNGYQMPDWLHDLSGAMVRYGTRCGKELRPPSPLESLALHGAVLLLRVTMKAGVWGRL